MVELKKPKQQRELGNKSKLIISIMIPFIVALIGSYFTYSTIDSWYATIAKPDFTPPNWLFGPVWTILYLMMGLSLYFIWIAGFDNKRVHSVLILFAFQLFLNVFWSFLFFGLNLIYYAFLEINALWFVIVILIFELRHVSRNAAYLLIPYLIWTLFATALNFTIFLVNL